MIQILVIEDEKRVADLLKIGLEENGYQVTSSSCHPKIFIKYTIKRCEFFGFYLYFCYVNPLTWQNPGQLFVAQDFIKEKIYSVAELR